jgi:hypothetical protein
MVTNGPKTNGHRWAHVFEAVAFAVGTFILVHQTVLVPSAQVVLVTAGLALMGVLPAGQLQRALIGRLEK